MFLDVTDQAQIDAVAGQIAGGGGSLDGVVNNTGIGRGGPLEYLPLETWREQLEVNVLGQVAVTKAMLPFIRAAHGRIVFIGSISGKVATQLTGPYGASKFAIEAIGESLRSELRPWGISVSVVEPAAVKTPIWDKTRQEADRLERALPEEARTRYARHIAAIRKGIQIQQRHAASPARSLPWSSTRCSPAARRPATWPGPTPGCRPCWSGGCPTGRGKRSSAGSPGRRLAIATSRARPAGTAATGPATGSRWSLARGGTVFLDVASNRWDRSARHNAAGFEGKARIGWVQICCTVMVLVMIGRWLERP